MPERRPPFSLSIINGSNIEDYLQGIRSFDIGNDSSVMRVGRYAVHRYPKLPLEKILEYQHITDEMARHAPSYSAQIKDYGNTSLEVERLAKVLQSDKTSFVYGISGYVEGVRPVDDKDPLLTELLNQFTVDMRRTLGYRGIHVIASNTKLNRGLFGLSLSTCRITDVCTSISELRPF